MIEISLAAGCGTLLIAVGHWFPWRAVLHRELHRVEAYVYGVTSILAPAFVVLALRDDWYAIYLVGACTVAAGATTITTKAIDRIVEWRNELHDMKARQNAERRATSAHN
jgi:drug/metabolite transporter (DMT)-like permease